MDTLIRFIYKEETQYFNTSVLQAVLQSSRYIAISKSSSQTPLPLVGQRGPINTLIIKSADLNQPLQTKVLPPL